ncbi:MAG: hybrid sensor histidine kinase/response regulator [Caldilinea sp. CFX5]|nr:hybrid sensor histidine kinase/response regulator [Caldilinea sp. CFX5]
MPISSTPAPTGVEWEQGNHEPFQIMVGAGLVVGALLVFLAKPLATGFIGAPLPGKEGPLLGLLLVLMLLLATALSRVKLRLGWLALVGAVAVVVLLATSWQPAPGTAALWLLPVLPALFFLEAKVSLGVVGGSILLLTYGQLPAAATPLERTIITGLLLALWLINQLGYGVRLSLWRSYAAYYQHAWQQLEAARDDRQQLNQAKDNLAHAYVQLEHLTTLLRASKVEAEVARQAKEQFVANVSHELRTPLNMIIGFSEMIMAAPTTYAPTLPAALLADIGVIHRNSLHLSQLINDVLVLSQMDAGQMHLSRAWVEVATLVGEAVQAVEPLYKAKKLPLTTALPPTLPPLFCDRLRVRQVLLNLLSNAGRYTAQGCVQVEVTSTPTHLCFAVRDTGPGIAPEEQKRIFEPFQQSRTGQANQEGSGLGLTISRQLVELHKGRMWLESTPGAGSTFFFTLPAQPPDAIPTPILAPITRWINPYSTYREDAPRTLPPLPPAKEAILVLEEPPTISRQLAPLLEQAEVIPVADLAALTAATAAAPPALVLINRADVMADQRFGRRLAALPQRTPVVSCYLPGKEEACQQLKVMDYLIKPVTREALLAITARVATPGSTILLVEDEPELARLLRRQLSSAPAGYRLLHAGDGATALTLMQQRRPDLVLLDLGLPDRDGYDLLQEKNANPLMAPIPVIIISARDPLGGPVVANRLRVELVGGLSVRDIATCVTALSQALSPLQRLKRSTPSTSAPG